MPDGSVFERQQLLDEAEAEDRLHYLEAEPYLGEFAEYFEPTLIYAEALAPLYAVWDRINRGEQVFALIEAPPRHGKSTNCFYGFARHLRKYPKHLIGYGTYNGTFANEQSRLARSIAEKCGVWSNEMMSQSTSRFDASKTITHWQTPQGGGAKFFGRGMSALGSGFNVALIDDPIKNHEEAESELVLEECWNWALASVFNRLEPNGSFMAMHQRWTTGDLIGRFKHRIETGYSDAPPELKAMIARMGGMKWEIVTLKAIQDDGTPLMPQRFDLLALARIRLEITDFWWFAQYMQEPRPRSGRMFSENYPVWLTERDASGEPMGTNVRGEFIPFPRGINSGRKQLIFGVDTAGSDTINADWTAIVLLAVSWEWEKLTERDEIVVEVVHVWRERLNSPDVVSFVAEVCKSIPSANIGFEMMGPGAAQGQFLKLDHPELPIYEIRTHKSKRLRAGPMANYSKRGRVRLPVRAAWLSAFRYELVNFTGQEGRRDDQVDAAVHAFNLALQTPRPSTGLISDERGSGRGQGGY